MEIVFSRPPAEIFEACDKAFGIRGRRGVIFTVGPHLYNPDRIYIDPPLLAHEQVHSDRQLASGNVELWWREYLESPDFRFHEELVAHQREWEVIQKTVPSRQQRRQCLGFITARLSGSLYGHMVSRDKAKRLITQAMAG